MKHKFKQWLKEWLNKASQFNANKLAKKEQIKNAIVVLLIVGFSGGFYYYSSHDQKPLIKSEEPQLDGVFDSAFNQGSDEALIEKQQKQIDELKNLMTNQVKTQADLTKAHEVTPEIKAMVNSLEEKLVRLEDENRKTNEQLQVALLKNSQANFESVPERPPTRQEMEARRLQRQRAEREIYAKAGLETVRFDYRRKAKNEERTARNYVWAGTFVEGVLLTGILGDAGINGSKNMGTAMIRLTSGGIMPNEQRSHLEGCFALVSSFGDLSGSSVVLHLETLSCAGRTLNFEQKVYGSVFDLDAMQDLRGTSILKTKPLLSYTAAAGALAGIGDGLKNYGVAQTVNPGAGTVTMYGTGAAIAQSAAGGALSNPANRISDYIMRIADIYHPLVVAKAGRRVSVLFTKGFWIDKEHQVYESGKSIDDQANQAPMGVTTTVSHAGDYEQGNVVNSQVVPGTSTQFMPGNAQAEQLFLQQSSGKNSALFSNVQGGEGSHD